MLTPVAFAELKEIKESGLVKDPLLARQLELLYNTYLEGRLIRALFQNRSGWRLR